MRRSLLTLLLPAAAAAGPPPTFQFGGTVAGRAFVADRALVLEQAIAGSSSRPDRALPRPLEEVLERAVGAKPAGTLRLGQLQRVGAQYRGPGALAVSADYVDYLADRIGKAALGLDAASECDPLVVRRGAAAVGLLMPLQGDLSTRPRSYQEPAWTLRGTLADGRRVAADKSLVLIGEKAPAAASEMPKGNLEAIQRWMSAPPQEAVPLSRLSCSSAPGAYKTPSGTLLGTRYVDLLRERFAGRALVFGSTGPEAPVVLSVDGKPVGVLMPMRP